MANVTAATLAACKRTLFYRVNAQGVPIRQPFQIVTIDSDLSFYEPSASQRFSSIGIPADGTVEGVVYLSQGGPVPPPPPGQTGVFGVFSYNGI